MTTWNFDSTIPATNNDPSQDQPKMLQNNVSTEGILDEDHYTFESTVNGNSVDGQHKSLRFPTQNALGGQTNPASGVYTAAGSASTNSDLRFRNESGIFPLSAIRSCGYFLGSTDTVGPFPINLTLLNGFNIVTMGVNKTATNTYTIELEPTAVLGNDVIVVTGQSLQGQSLTWAFTNPILTISSGSTIGATRVSFVVLQI